MSGNMQRAMDLQPASGDETKSVSHTSKQYHRPQRCRALLQCSVYIISRGFYLSLRTQNCRSWDLTLGLEAWSWKTAWGKKCTSSVRVGREQEELLFSCGCWLPLVGLTNKHLSRFIMASGKSSKVNWPPWQIPKRVISGWIICFANEPIEKLDEKYWPKKKNSTVWGHLLHQNDSPLKGII